jgi:biotin carboxyl carrier protein
MSDYVVTIGNNKKNVKILSDSKIILNGITHDCEIIPMNGISSLIKVDNTIYQVSLEKHDNENFTVLINGKKINATLRTALQEKAAGLLENSSASHRTTEVKAPMPGMILKVMKSEGDIVEQGESVMILEAMKMENDLRSPVSGTIFQIYVQQGNPVEKGAKLFKVE